MYRIRGQIVGVLRWEPEVGRSNFVVGMGIRDDNVGIRLNDKVGTGEDDNTGKR